MQLLETATPRYDVFVTEAFGTEAMLMFAHRLGLPAILISPTGLQPRISECLANPANPSYIPHPMSPGFRPPMTFTERIQNTVLYLISTLTFRQVVEHENRMIRSFLGPGTPSLYEMLMNVSLIFVNTHESLYPIAASVPTVVTIGGIHIKACENYSAGTW